MQRELNFKADTQHQSNPKCYYNEALVYISVALLDQQRLDTYTEELKLCV